MFSINKYLPILAVAISACNLSFAMDNPNYDIIIVGGGLSGLNAARTIHEMCPKLNIAVVEGRDRLGGRTSTITIHGKQVEAGGEFIDRDQIFIQKTLDELGLEKTPVRLDGEIFGILESKKVTLDALKELLSTAIPKLKDGKEKITDTNYIRFDDNSNTWVFSSFCSFFNFTASEFSFLQCLVRDEYGIDLDKAPITCLNNLLERLETYEKLVIAKTMPFISFFANNLVFNNYDYQYRIEGGTQALVQALASTLPSNSIHMNTCLNHLSRDNNGSYVLRMENGSVFRANKVILSTPFSVLNSQYGILDDISLGITPQLRRCIDTMAYGTNSKLIIPAASFTPTSYVLNTDHGGITAWQNPAGITWMLGGKVGAELGKESIQVQELSAHMPVMFNASISDQCKPIIVNWSQDSFSRGSYSARNTSTPILDLYDPSKTLLGLYDFATPLNNNTLFFVGEHTCCGHDGIQIPDNFGEPIHSGYMQSALFSGHIVGKFIGSLI